MAQERIYPKGYLSVVLHAHLPFVRHPEFDEYLEEEWLFEAILETYLPLLQRFYQLEDEGVDFCFTMTVSPPLASMLADPLLRQRAIGHLSKLQELAHKEVERTRDDAGLHPVACFYRDRLAMLRELWLNRLGGDIVGALRGLQDRGHLEIITCGATHGLLPLMQVEPRAVEAQIKVGVQAYEHFFGRKPRGIWLPECAYYPGLDEILAREGIRFFFVDSHGIWNSNPKALYGVYAPIITSSSVAAFARDPESSKQVWSSKEGYPGDFNYREFYRDVGWDLDFDYIRPYIQPTGLRKFTGLKYYKITGTTDHKEPYSYQTAMEKVAEHAGNFAFNREQQISYLNEIMGRPPIVVSPYDAELFGHWWFEGPDFLYYLAKKLHYDSTQVKLTTPMYYLDQFPAQQKATPAHSSWGDKGYYDVWVNGSNDWIYPHLHETAERMVRLADFYPDAEGLLRRALNQCARELLLAQSSDWAFLMSTGTAVEYSTRRTKNHVGRFLKLYDQIVNQCIDERYVAELEGYDNIFPFIDYNIYRS